MKIADKIINALWATAMTALVAGCLAASIDNVLIILS